MNATALELLAVAVLVLCGLPSAFYLGTIVLGQWIIDRKAKHAPQRNPQAHPVAGSRRRRRHRRCEGAGRHDEARQLRTPLSTRLKGYALKSRWVQRRVVAKAMRDANRSW